MAYLKPILAGLCASAITYLCFLTWIHMKATSAARERGTTGLIAVAGGAAYVLHSPAFWALAIIAFGVAFFLFRDAK
jgi:chromate transport protein ChrA